VVMVVLILVMASAVGAFAATITVTSPAAGAQWKAGTSQAIDWTSSSDVGPVKVLLQKGAVTFAVLESSVGFPGSLKNEFLWTVPLDLMNGQDYAIVVISNKNPSIKGTSGAFSINKPTANNGKLASSTAKPPSAVGNVIIVNQPAGGIFWQPGATNKITWTNLSGDTTGKVDLVLYLGNNLVRPIAADVPINQGSLDWKIPADVIPGNQYRIQVASATNSALQAFSDFFSLLTPTITVTTPAGGENWAIGIKHDITWKYAGNVGNFVHISLQPEPGTQGAAAVLAADIHLDGGGKGTFSWPIPANSQPGAYRIKVISENPGVVGTSAPFSLNVEGKPVITVTETITYNAQTNNRVEYYTWRRDFGEKICWDTWTLPVPQNFNGIADPGQGAIRIGYTDWSRDTYSNNNPYDLSTSVGWKENALYRSYIHFDLKGVKGKVKWVKFISAGGPLTGGPLCALNAPWSGSSQELFKLAPPGLDLNNKDQLCSVVQKWIDDPDHNNFGLIMIGPDEYLMAATKEWTGIYNNVQLQISIEH